MIDVRGIIPLVSFIFALSASCQESGSNAASGGRLRKIQNCGAPNEFDDCRGCRLEALVECCEKAASPSLKHCEVSKASGQASGSENWDCQLNNNHSKGLCFQDKDELTEYYLDLSLIRPPNGDRPTLEYIGKKIEGSSAAH